MSKRAESPEEVPLSFVDCRAFRHQPRAVNATVTRGAGGQIVEFTRIAKCIVCQTQISTTYAQPDWRVTRRKYDYPERYQVKGGWPLYDARAKFVDLIDRASG